MNVKNITNSNGKSVPNQHIVTSEDFVVFQSYDNKIAEFNREFQSLKIFSDWNYSKTTMKYLKTFINEETCFNYESKKQWEKEMQANDKIDLV